MIIDIFKAASYTVWYMYKSILTDIDNVVIKAEKFSDVSWSIVGNPHSIALHLSPGG